MEIIEIKAERSETAELDETDLTAVVSLDVWREKVRKVNVLLKYVERLVDVKPDVKVDFNTIRILASNTKVTHCWVVLHLASYTTKAFMA